MEPYEYCASSYAQEIVQHLFEMQKLKQMCDLILVVEDEDIYVHKMVLAAVSPYFRTLSNSTFKENADNKVEFNGIDKDILKTIINFIYTGKIQINDDNVYQIMEAASRFQIWTLKLPLSYFLVTALKTKTCMQTLAFASLYEYEEVIQQTLKFIANNILFVIKRETFYLAPIHIIKLVLCQCNINLEYILYGLKIWIHHNFNDDILSTPDCSTYSNLKIACRECFENTQMSSLLQTILDFIDKNFFGKFTNRQLIENQVILSIGGNNKDTTHSTVESFYKTWTFSLPFLSSYLEDGSDPASSIGHIFYPSMSTPRRCFTVAQPINDSEIVYVIGGESMDYVHSDEVLDCCEKYNVTENRWSILKNMPRKLKNHTATWVDGKILVLGGETDELGIVNDVWEYYPKDDRWQAGTPMPWSRTGHGAVNVLGNLYVLGGKCGTTGQLCCHIDRYNPELQTWTNIGCMLEPKSKFGCVAIQECIYIIGGARQQNVLKSVQKFNTLNNSWETCEDMPAPKCSFGCTVKDDKIYCVGGYDMVHGPLSTVVVFNPQTNRWHYSSDKLHNARAYSCAATVKIFTDTNELRI